MANLTPGQQRYMEAAGHPNILKAEEEAGDGNWILVDFVPNAETAAALAQAEQLVGGEKVEYADTAVWVDERGFEHYGPGETGYDRFGIGEEVTT